MSAVYAVDIQIKAPVNDTEVTDRVADAVRTLFPEADPTHQQGALVAEVHTMDGFSELLHRREILDTARSVFFDNLEGDTFAFDVKKQAAFEGRINFAVGDPSELGDIRVNVTVNEPSAEEYINYVAPPTEDGQPVYDEDS
ncbi:RNA-binding domain-containing protein [Haloarcula sp. Atlit-120R]|uniref:RNA-binding domain-containing protein n=1 Tax=Haloarcula sp. Atlit-120R TaxID=2282135 RepID=UPI000EF1E20A|nr:RNA-binding domain-containing protein [Haloarcula sp. Atlit-120R]RLM36544.1 coaE operon protein [Haloarcula sp. Atlit-120R]